MRHSHRFRNALRYALTFLRREYTGNFLGDLSGGITTAIVALPLALAFAIASGVPAKYGLYTAIVTGIVAAIFGGSKVQVSGPTGGMAAVLIVITTQFGYEKVILIAFMAGVIQVCMAAGKLGRFVRMLPFPLIAGFTTGIAIIIFGGQIDLALGLDIHHQATQFFDRMVETGRFISTHGVSMSCVFVSGIVIASYLLILRLWPKLPAAMIAILIGAFVTGIFGLQIPMIRDIPSSLPTPRFPIFSWNMLRDLLRPAASIAALGAIESLLAATVADTLLSDGSRHQPNRELFGQGLANMTTSFFGGIPCTGAIARTAVNVKSGGRTRLAAIIHSVFLLLILSFCAPLATRIPIAALAGILIVISGRMVEWHELRWLLRAPKSDVVVLGVTIAITAFTDLVVAVEFGLATAGILFVNRMSQLHPIDVTETSDNALLAQQLGKKIKAFRIPGPLFWGASHALVDTLDQCDNTRAVILKMQLVSLIDATGVAALREARQRLLKRGIRLYLSATPSKTLKTLVRMGVFREIGEKNFHPDLETARLAALDDLSVSLASNS